jgi:hypothetical protein
MRKIEAIQSETKFAFAGLIDIKKHEKIHKIING